MPTKPPVIVADSTIALPDELTRDLPLLTVPFEVHHAGTVYRDGQDLTPTELYALLRESSTPPVTSTPQIGSFLIAFGEAARTTDTVICLTLSAALSAAHQAAVLAQREARQHLPDLSVHLMDTRTAGPAEGLVALEAARAAAAGRSAADILTLIAHRSGTVHLMAYLDTLYYVWRSGRVPRAAFWLTRMLGVKPILHFSTGGVDLLERPRTAGRALERLVALTTHHLGDRRGRIAVVHADAPRTAEELAARMERDLNPVELFISEFTPVLGTHTGPGLVGCAFHPVEEDAVGYTPADGPGA